MFNQQVHEEACEWFVRMRDGGDDDPLARAALMSWLRRSPEHVSAYLDAAALWMESKHVQVDADLSLPTRIAQARADSAVASLIPPPEPARGLFTRRGGLLATAASILIACLALPVAWWYYNSPTYTTELGEQRSLSFPDGSIVDLDSNSSVRVQFGKNQRLVYLLSGQALFHVAKDPSRPFVVHADNATVRAVGTEFDVYRKSTGTMVTVLEGRVSVHSKTLHQLSAGSQAPEPPTREDTILPGAQDFMLPSGQTPGTTARVDELLLVAGEQLTISARALAKSEHPNLASAIAWTQRQLIFDTTPLSEVAQEFNRYNTRHLVIEGDRLAAFRVTAMFRSTDPRSLVRFVQTISGVQVEESENRIVIRSTRDPQN